MSSRDSVTLEGLKQRKEDLKLRVMNLKDHLIHNDRRMEDLDNRILNLHRRRRVDTGDNKLLKISTVMEHTQRTIESMTVMQLDEITKYPRPPEIIQKALEAIFLLLRGKRYTWDRIRSEITNGCFIREVLHLNLATVSPAALEIVKKEYIQTDAWDLGRLQRASKAMGPLGNWLQCQIELADFSKSNKAASNVIEINSEIKNLEAQKTAIEEESQTFNFELISLEEELEKLDDQIQKLEEEQRGALNQNPDQSLRISLQEKNMRKLNQISELYDEETEHLCQSFQLQGAGFLLQGHKFSNLKLPGLTNLEDPSTITKALALFAQQTGGSLLGSKLQTHRILEMTTCYFIRQLINGKSFASCDWDQKVADKNTQTEDALMSLYVERVLAQQHETWQKERSSLLQRVEGNQASLQAEWQDLERERTKVEAVSKQLEATLANNKLAFEQEKETHQQKAAQTMQLLEAERESLTVLKNRLASEAESERMRLENERLKFEKLSVEMQQKFARKAMQESKRASLGHEGVQTDPFLLQEYLDQLQKLAQAANKRESVVLTRESASSHNELFNEPRRISALAPDLSLPNLNISAVHEIPVTAQNTEDNLKALDDQEVTILETSQSFLGTLKQPPPQVFNVQNASGLQFTLGTNRPVQAAQDLPLYQDEVIDKRKFGDRFGKIGIVWQNYYDRKQDSTDTSLHFSALQSLDSPLILQKSAFQTRQPVSSPPVPNRVFLNQSSVSTTVNSQPSGPIYVPGRANSHHQPSLTPQHKPSASNHGLITFQLLPNAVHQPTFRMEMVPQTVKVRAAPQLHAVRSHTPEFGRQMSPFHPASQQNYANVAPVNPAVTHTFTPKTSGHS